MKNPKNIELFMSKKEIKFETHEKMIYWVKRNLNLEIILKVGPNYLADEQELERAFEQYLRNQTKLYKQRKLKLEKNKHQNENTNETLV